MTLQKVVGFPFCNHQAQRRTRYILTLNFQNLVWEAYKKKNVDLDDYSMNSFVRIQCFIAKISDLLIPAAYASSCKAKDSSEVSFKEGILIKLDLSDFTEE